MAKQDARVDDNDIAKNPFMITIEGHFTKIEDVINYALQDERTNADQIRQATPVLPPSIKALVNEAGQEDTYLSPRFSGRKCRDSSLGGNDTVNCYPQFCIDDDIIHPLTAVDPQTCKTGMGRVYNEIYDDQQQILYLSFGVPEFGNPVEFYKDLINSNLAAMMNTGEVKGSEIGRLFGTTVGVVLALPFLPVRWLIDAVDSIRTTKVTKYYDFRCTMELYYRFVNSMLVHLAVNMGLQEALGQYTADSNTQGVGKDVSYGSVGAQPETDPTEGQVNIKSLPDIFSKYGFDCYKILCRKYEMKTGKDVTKSSEEYLQELKSADRGQSSFYTAFDNATLDADMYVGFRIEKSTDGSESISSSTSESRIAQVLNSKSAEGRDTAFSARGLDSDGALAGVFSTLAAGISGVLAGAASVFNYSGLSEVIKGSAIVDIPEVWSGSSFSKSYSFNIQLRAHYGDPMTIMQRIYFPLCMILAGSLPRAAGKNAYTSPFLCRAYSRGLFSIPLGIIDSVSIRRGADQYGWNNDHLPTCVDVSLTIKDLSPAMYLAMADSNTSFLDVFTQDSTFQEYMMTLSGMGIAERTLFWKNLRRKAKIILGENVRTKLNPFYWGNRIAHSSVGNIYSAIRPSSNIPNG